MVTCLGTFIGEQHLMKHDEHARTLLQDRTDEGSARSELSTLLISLGEATVARSARE